MALAALPEKDWAHYSMITCQEFLAEFGDYLESKVSAEVREELERHLSECRVCRVLYDSSCKTVKIVTESRVFELPEKVSAPIINRVMAKLRKDRK